ncbi:uncharacterized protein ARMOST_22650 [Armillaria ostoyae]|uniref:Uncharacterized protein n=1 Tax=Armillaria ostoyae TaxID=47428 RepID=A0A284SDJ7_ARMOS|nr:uncharacterized protein ARMOST_13186 [Armillaria ostoyae]SJL19043.1 uncharacterized protein ARMOST_22650 [Armillaria ostoyae]
MARPRGSVIGAVLFAMIESVPEGAPKKTSGLVHAATALRMCVVKNATQLDTRLIAKPDINETSSLCAKKEGHIVHPTETFTWNHLEVNTLITIFRIYKVRQLDRIKLYLS